MKQSTKIESRFPNTVMEVSKVLNDNGFECYVVGGCVRDTILGEKPTDWDLTTNAKPEDIQKLFTHTVYENNFGTVEIVFDDEKDISSKIIQVTPYRTEGKYSDLRRPDEVKFSDSLEKDLERRDFTINAMAINPTDGSLIDLFQGIQDLTKKEIRCVGNPEERFMEDALRMIRAVRIATKLNGRIEKETKEVIKKLSDNLSKIPVERVSDEFKKIILTDNPEKGILLLEELFLLKNILPELREGIDMEQNQSHSFDVFTHNIKTLQHSANKNLNLNLRLSALLHDIGKPRTRDWDKNRKEWSFHNHEVVGTKMTKEILKRLKYPKEIIESVSLFVRWHMFFADTEKISLSAVRRLIARIGKENIWEMINLRICDRLGMGRPKEEPYRLRKYKSMIEQVLRDPIDPTMLVVNGSDIIKDFNEKPSPRIGYIQHSLLAIVLEDPSQNTKEKMYEHIKKLVKLDDKQLKKLGEEGRIKKFEEDKKDLEAIKRKNLIN